MSETPVLFTPDKPDNSAAAEATVRKEWWSLRLIIILLFSQVWRDIGGFTLRMDDLVALAMAGWWLLPSLQTGVFHYYRSRLNKPLALWMFAIAVGTGVTLAGSFAPVVKQDALVNGVRLLLALSLYFVVNNHPLPVERKIRIFFSTIIIFSFITSFVALLQIAHWSGVLPFSLPSVLTTFKPGADTELGREIFALFLGNTGTHTWSSMLAMQALAVWLVSVILRKRAYRLAGLAYFLVLCLILVRTSVRNSILGLGIAIFTILFVFGLRSRFPVNRVVKPLLLVGGAALGVVILLALAPQSYFLERIIEAIPRITSAGLEIDRGSNIVGRIDYTANALLIYRAYPVLGGGFGSYQTLSGTIGSISIIHAHNSFAQTVAELGTLGGLALLWLIWAIIRCLRDAPPRQGASPAKVQIWYFTIGAMMFIVFTAFFSNPFWEPNQVAFRMILLGILTHIQRDTWT